MLSLDTSQPLRGHTQLTSLLDAVYNASPEDEADWIEWKGRWDFSTNVGRGHTARHILGMANRVPDVASRVAGGCGYVVFGVEPDQIATVPRVDLATLEPQIQAFLGDNGPIWDIHWLTHKGHNVAVVIVDPPKEGDPAHTLRKELEKTNGGNYPAGALFVRRKGATHTANPHEVDLLVRRAQPKEDTTRLDVELAPAEGQLIVTPLDIGETSVNRWIEAERDRLIAPLHAERETPTEDPLDLSQPLAAIAFTNQTTTSRLALLTEQVAGHYRKPEDRSQEDYEAEVERYLEKAAEVLPGVAIDRHIESEACVLSLVLRNPTDHPWGDVSTEVYIAGEGFRALDGPEHNEMPKPPRVWGPRLVDILGDFDAGRRLGPIHGSLFDRMPMSGPSGPWVEIDNGGSARLRFSPVDLPPRSMEQVAEVHLLVRSDLAGSRLLATWEARSTHASGVAEGRFEIEISDRPATADELLLGGP